jgi:release factor glutamine methyltransferase
VAELAEVVGAPHEARFIVDEVLGLGLALGHPDPPTGPLDAAAVSTASAMAARRAAGEPLQYVFGHWAFRRLDLIVDERVLIPRPETEQVVEIALNEARRLAARDPSGEGLVLADVGTGSGAIALALATELGPGVVAEVWATDASADALAVAASNLEAVLRSSPAGSRPPAVTLVEGSWLEPLPASRRRRLDLVVSNPPYVSEAEWSGLAAEVRCEPRQALVAGAAGDGTPGLADVETVLRQSLDWLRRPGSVVIELAPHQADAAVALAAGLGYDETGVELDLARRPRVLVARTSE